MTHVCLRNVVTDGSISGGMVYKTELGRQMFSVSQVILCACVLSKLIPSRDL